MMWKKMVAVGCSGSIYFLNMAYCFFYFVVVGSFGSGFVDDLREQLSCCFCMHFTIINHFVIDENNLIIKTNDQSTLFLQSFQVLEYLLILFFVNLWADVRNLNIYHLLEVFLNAWTSWRLFTVNYLRKTTSNLFERWLCIWYWTVISNLLYLLLTYSKKFQPAFYISS